MKINHAGFLQKQLAVHSFLAEVPLLDVWGVFLAGGGPGRTLQDVIDAIEAADAGQINPIVRGLFALREAMGRIFKWDDMPKADSIPEESFLHKLTDEMIAKSLRPPNERVGPVRVIYQYEHEGLAETINATTHAFIHLSLEAVNEGYMAYLAVYAINTKWWSRYYMALIEPFRRFLVYPTMMRALKRAWAAAV